MRANVRTRELVDVARECGYREVARLVKWFVDSNIEAWRTRSFGRNRTMSEWLCQECRVDPKPSGLLIV
jgi:hypothetical protein